MNTKKSNVLRKLFAINLIYAYPMVTTQLKNKMSKKKQFDFTKKVRNNYLIGGFFIIFLYTIFTIFMDFKEAPLLLDFFVIMLLLMGVLQNFIYFFNVFYESKDIEAYMALPIDEKTVFLSKLLTISFTGLQMSLPIFTIFFIFFIKMGKGIVFAGIFALIDFLILFLISTLFNMILTLLLAKLNSFQKYKNIFTVALMILAITINVAVMILMQMEAREALLTKFFTGVESTFFISHLTTSLGGQAIFIVSFGLLSVLGVFIVYKMMSKGFYNTILKVNSISSATKTDKKISAKKSIFKRRSIVSSLLKQNLNQLKDGTLLSQIIVMELLFLIIIVSSFFTATDGVKFFFSMYSQYILPLMAMLGVLLGNTGNNFAAFCVSLDGEVYNFLKALPISRKTYTFFKIIFAGLIQNLLIIFSIIVLGIFLEVNALDIVLSVGIVAILGGALSTLWVIYDFNHLLLDWSSATQLMTKFGKVIPFILMMAGMLLTGILIGSIVAVEEAVSVGMIYTICYIVSISFSLVAVVKVRELIKTNP